MWQGIQHGVELLKEGLSWEPGIGEEVHPYWSPSLKGKFITKLAYEILCNPEVSEDFNWKHLWNVKGLVRSSLTLWITSRDQLKTRYLLWQRNIVDNPRCELCNALEETAMHAIRDYEKLKQVWRLLLLRNM